MNSNYEIKLKINKFERTDDFYNLRKEGFTRTYITDSFSPEEQYIRPSQLSDLHCTRQFIPNPDIAVSLTKADNTHATNTSLFTHIFIKKQRKNLDQKALCSLQ